MASPKEPKRVTARSLEKRLAASASPSGRFRCTTQGTPFAAKLGELVSNWPHVEEKMVDFMGLLIGWPTSSSLARPIFYGITGQNARIKVMRAMLERSAHNARKGSEFDLIITDFAALNDRRNKYVHGLWYTFEDGTVWLSESAVNALHFLEWRVVQIDEIDGALAEMGALLRRIDNLIMAEMKALVPAPPQPSGPDEGP